MRKELLATLLISVIWIVVGLLTAYSAWEMGMRWGGYTVQSLPDPYTLGLILGISALALTFVIVRTLLPSRTTQRRRLMRLLDEIGVEDIDTIQQKLAALSDDPEELDRAATLRTLLQEPKRKNQAD